METTRKTDDNSLNTSSYEHGQKKENGLKSLFSRMVSSIDKWQKCSCEEYEQIQRVVDSVPEEDKEYVLKVAELGAILGANQFSLELLTLSLHADQYRGDSFLDGDGRNKLGTYVQKVVQTTSDVNEILSLHFTHYGRNNAVPKQMRKHLKLKLETFNEQELSKGLDRTEDVTLRDSIKLLRPKPSGEKMEDFFRAIIKDDIREDSIEPLMDCPKHSLDMLKTYARLYDLNSHPNREVRDVIDGVLASARESLKGGLVPCVH